MARSYALAALAAATVLGAGPLAGQAPDVEGSTVISLDSAGTD